MGDFVNIDSLLTSGAGIPHLSRGRNIVNIDTVLTSGAGIHCKYRNFVNIDTLLTSGGDVVNRRLGGESNREISAVPGCVILSLGFIS